MHSAVAVIAWDFVTVVTATKQVIEVAAILVLVS